MKHNVRRSSTPSCLTRRRNYADKIESPVKPISSITMSDTHEIVNGVDKLFEEYHKVLKRKRHLR